MPVHACKIGQQQSDVRQRARAPSGSAPRLTAVDALVAIPSRDSQSFAIQATCEHMRNSTIIDHVPFFSSSRVENERRFAKMLLRFDRLLNV